MTAREIALRQEIEGPNETVVGTSPDGRWLKWRTAHGVTLWNVERRAAASPPGHAVYFSPDGRLSALSTIAPAPRSVDEIRRTIAGAAPQTIWDLELQQARGQYEGVFLGFSPDGRYLLSTMMSAAPGGIRLWEVATSRPRVLPTSEGGFVPEWSPDGRFLAFYDSNNDIQVWDLQPEPPVGRVLPEREKQKGNRGRCVTFEGDGRRGVSGLFLGPDGRVLCDSCRVTDLWKLSGPTPELALRTELLPLTAGRAVLSRNGHTLAYAWGTGTHLHRGGGFALWDVAAGEPLGSPIRLDDPGAMEFNPDGSLLAIAGYGVASDGKKSNIVQIWHVAGMRSPTPVP